MTFFKTTKAKSVTLVFLVLIFVFFLIVGARNQTMEGDEGGYLMCQKLTAEGRIPAIDYKAAQMPLFYYVYGYWMKVFGYDIDVARILAIILTFTLGMCLVAYSEKLFRNRMVSVAALFLFVFNLHYFAYNVHMKHYALSNSFLFISFVLLSVFVDYRGAKLKDRFFLILVGLTLGVSANTRLPIYGLLPVVLVWLVYVGKSLAIERKNILLNCTLVLVGFAIASIPTLLIFLQSPKLFMFSFFPTQSWAYEEMRMSQSIIQKILIGKTFFLIPQEKVLLLFLFGSLVLFIKYFRKSKNLLWDDKKTHSFVLALAFFMFLLLIYFKAPLFFIQYWNQSIPYFIVLTLFSFNYLFRLEKSYLKATAYVFLSILFVFYGVCFVKAGGIREGRPGVKTSPIVMLIHDHRNYPSFKSIGTAKEVARILRLIVPDGDVIVYTHQPYPVFESGNLPFPGFERGAHSILWKYIPSDLQMKYEEEYNWLSENTVKAAIRDMSIPIILIDPDMPEKIQKLVKSTYHLYKQVYEYGIYTNKPWQYNNTMSKGS